LGVADCEAVELGTATGVGGIGGWKV
jgi:hypothetical protein